MAELLASKIVIEEESPRLRAIPGRVTSVARFVGITQRGPIGVATRVTSIEEFRKIFGAYLANAQLPQAVLGFFLQGGREAWVVRTVHYTNPDLPLSKTSASATATLTTGGAATAGAVLGSEVEPFPFNEDLDLDVEVNGAGAVTASFTGTAPAARSTGGFPTAFVGGEVLTLNCDGLPQVVTFGAGDQTAQDVCNAINAQLIHAHAVLILGQVEIRTDDKGNAVTLQVSVGGANATLLLPTGLQTGTGNVGRLSGVTVAEVKSVVEGAVAGVTVTNMTGAVRIASNTVGASSSIRVAPCSADGALGLDNFLHSGTAAGPGNTARVDAKYDGAYGNDLSATVQNATSGVAGEFNFLVLQDGQVAEVYPNLSMDPNAASYAEGVVNNEDSGSNLVKFVDLLAGVPPANRPTNQTVTLALGGDGLAGLNDNDFIGSGSGPTGLRCYDNVLGLANYAAPDRPTAAVHNALISFVAGTRGGEGFAVLDPPAGMNADEIITYVETTAALLGLSEYGAIYWPQVLVLNPDTSVFGSGSNIQCPPSGHVCGVFARTAARRDGGIYDPPAGVEIGVLSGVVGVETDQVLDERKRDLVFPKRINPLTRLTGAYFIDGARTLKANGNFPYVSERVGVNFIEWSIKDGLQTYRHRNNNKKLRSEVERTIRVFLLDQMRVGAFSSNDPDTAFFVDVSDSLNPPSVVAAGQLIVRIGLATNKPAEYIILRFSQDTRALEEQIALG